MDAISFSAFTKLAQHIQSRETSGEVPSSSGAVKVTLIHIMSDDEVRAFNKVLRIQARFLELDSYGIHSPRSREALNREVFFPLGHATSVNLQSWIRRNFPLSLVHNLQTALPFPSSSSSTSSSSATTPANVVSSLPNNSSSSTSTISSTNTSRSASSLAAQLSLFLVGSVEVDEGLLLHPRTRPRDDDPEESLREPVHQRRRLIAVAAAEQNEGAHHDGEAASSSSGAERPPTLASARATEATTAASVDDSEDDTAAPALPSPRRRRVVQEEFLPDVDINAADPPIRRYPNRQRRIPLRLRGTPGTPPPPQRPRNRSRQQHPRSPDRLAAHQEEGDPPSPPPPIVGVAPAVVLEVAPPVRSERQLLQEALKEAGLGQKPVTPLDQQQAFRKSLETFINAQHTAKLVQCIRCRERVWPDDKQLIDDTAPYECKRCTQDKKSRDIGIYRFSHENDMDPFHHPDPQAMAAYKTLQTQYPLNEVEEMLIARHAPVMKIYRLKGHRDGQNVAFSGNVINVVQDIQPLVDQLPRLPADLPVFKVRRKHGDGPDEYKDFIIRREHVRQWLYFLKRWNIAYQDITIITENIESLPTGENGETVGSQLRDLLPADNRVEVRNDDNEVPVGVDAHGEVADSEQEETESVDGGVEEGAMEVNTMEKDNVVETGISGMALTTPEDEVEAIRRAIQRNPAQSGVPAGQQDRVQWPERGASPLDEYNTEFLLAMSFPTLFPFGNGDVTNKTSRKKEVSFHDACQHYQRYAIKLPNGSWNAPFSSNHRFMHYIQNVDERRRMVSQCNVYMQQNPDDATLTIDDLREMSRDANNPTLWALERRMRRYSSNMLGSDAYMHERKRELLALIQDKGMPTIWFTLSLANHYWEDLQRLFEEPPRDVEGETEEEYNERWKRSCHKHYASNPHIVDEFFIRRVKAFIETFFGADGLEACWHWYRYEWQQRGNIHVHGLTRLKSDPDLTVHATNVVKGRKAAQMLRINREEQRRQHIPTSYEALDLSPPEGDTYLTHLEDTMRVTFSETPLSEESIQDLLQQKEVGERSAVVIVVYRDYLLTSMHPAPPADAEMEERAERDQPTPEVGDHFCSNCHPVDADGKRKLGDDTVYIDLLNWCNRHRHTPNYCLRCGKSGTLSCRFHFPRSLEVATRVVIKEEAYQQHETKKGQLRHTKVEIAFLSNDKWLNSHSKIGLLGWGANMDMSILIDPHAVTEYVCKYCTKSERVSKGLNAIFNTAIQKRRDQGDLETKRVLRTVFNAQNERDKSSQETAHIVASHPYVCCSHNFIHINLTSRLRKVNTATTGGSTEEGNGQNAYQSNIIDAYEKLRFLPQAWASSEQKPFDAELEHMAPTTFFRLYTLNKDRKITARARSELAVMMFSPSISCDTTKPSYWQYCWVSLRKFKPYSGVPESLYGGSAEDNIRSLDIDRQEPPPQIKAAIIDAWEAFLRGLSEDERGQYDGLFREVERLQQRNELAEILQDGEVLSGDAVFDVDNDNPLEYEQLCRYLFEIELERTAIQWSEQHDFTVPNHDYHDDEFSVNHVKEKWNQLNERANTSPHGDNAVAPVHDGGPLRDLVDLSKCKAQQLDAVLVWKYINIHWKEANRERPWEDTGSNYLDNVLIMKGFAGVGKSFTIDAMIQETLNLPGNEDKLVLVMAPTGRAALNANGVTLHSKDGLQIPVNNGRSTGRDLQGDGLIRLQQRFANVCAVIIDEYSMVSLSDLHWIDRRLQQAKKSTLPFGGIPLCFAGDPGQLPPVLALSMWATRTSSNKNLGGNALVASSLYRRIKYVVNLEEVVRQDDIRQIAVLSALRDGKINEDDWHYINGLCSERAQKQRLGDQYAAAFESIDTIHIYFTNAEAAQHNIEQLQKLNSPIVRINADHDCASSAARSAECTQRLPAVLYLARNAKVMLHKNTLTKEGLVNGSTGVVKDILYEDGKAAPNLPFAIIIDFQEYKGPPFFTGEDKKTWVPLLTEEVEWDTDGRSHFRRSFPIALAYAITAWKSQGQTIKSHMCVRLGDKEPEHGATYVVFSRPDDLTKINIGGGVGLDRITTKIANGKKLKERLKEDERLNVLSISTRHFFSQQLTADIETIRNRVVPMIVT